MYCSKKKVLLSLFRTKGVSSKDLYLFFRWTEEQSARGKVFQWDDWTHIMACFQDFAFSNLFLTNLFLTEYFVESWKTIDDYLSQCEGLGIQIIPYWDVLYPMRLRALFYPPLFLFFRGESKILNVQPTVGIIGSRNPSSYIFHVGVRLALRCAEYGFVVVSGLALGCDTAAHHGCLQGNGQTIAVLAHGLAHSVYPKQNIQLAHKILSNNGCLLSEYDIFAPPHRKNFLQRNRILVSLSAGIIILYAHKRSGTEATVRIAKKEGKPLGFFCTKGCVQTEESLNQELEKRKMGIALRERKDIQMFLTSLVCR